LRINKNMYGHKFELIKHEVFVQHGFYLQIECFIIHTWINKAFSDFKFLTCKNVYLNVKDLFSYIILLFFVNIF
jgi:hypothetical protein